MGSKAFESPLISHVRMRALYRARVEVRVLGRRLGKAAPPKGLEACWVGTAIDLQDGDLVLGGRVDGYLRSVSARAAAGMARLSEVRNALETEAPAFGGTATDRLLCAAGSAMALKARGEGACVAYAVGDEISLADWKHVLTVAKDGDLPLVLVWAGAPGGLRVAGVPVIPVDAGDVLAIYRVAQECLVRARADGGVAVIECLPMGTDPVKIFGAQLVKKQICTEKWVAGCEAQFRALVAKL